MFAVIRTGGKQYRVTPGEQIEIERVEGEVGSYVRLTDVMMVGTGDDVSVGLPLVGGASVSLEIMEQGRGPKVISFKKRRRQNSKRKKGHRQLLSLVRVAEILTDGAEPTQTEPSPRAETASQVATPRRARGGRMAAADDVDDTDRTDGAAGDTAMTASAEAPRSSRKAGSATGDEAVPAGAQAAARAAAAALGADDGEPGGQAGSLSGGAGAADTGKPLFDRPEGEPDDLEPIDGIGKRAEEMLHHHGIITIAQIAELTDEQIEQLDARIPFSAEQIRDWRRQAQETLKAR